MKAYVGSFGNCLKNVLKSSNKMIFRMNFIYSRLCLTATELDFKNTSVNSFHFAWFHFLAMRCAVM